MESLPSAAHDTSKLPTQLTDTLQRAVKEMRDYSAAVSRRADAWETNLQQLRGVGGAGLELEGDLHRQSVPITPEDVPRQDVPSDQPFP